MNCRVSSVVLWYAQVRMILQKLAVDATAEVSQADSLYECSMVVKDGFRILSSWADDEIGIGQNE